MRTSFRWMLAFVAYALVATRLLVAQNVGIGIANPLAKLHVIGSGIYGTFAPRGAIHTAERLRLTGHESDFIISVQDGNGRIQYKWNATPGTAETYLVSSEPAFFMNIGVVTDPYLRFRYAPSGTAGDPISWVSHLEISQAGNVGIGTAGTVPHRLTVLGGNIAMENTRSIVAQNNAGTYQSAIIPRWSDNRMYLTFGGGGLIIRDSTNTVVIRTEGVTGNVGIGPIIATQRLDIDGQIRIRGGGPSSGALLRATDATGTATWQSYSPIVTGSTNWQLGNANVSARNNNNTFATNGQITVNNTSSYARTYRVVAVAGVKSQNGQELDFETFFSIDEVCGSVEDGSRHDRRQYKALAGMAGDANGRWSPGYNEMFVTVPAATTRVFRQCIRRHTTQDYWHKPGYLVAYPLD